MILQRTKVLVELNCTEKRWYQHVAELNLFVSEVVKKTLEGKQGGLVSVLMTNNFDMCELNTKYNQLQKPTNVLAFPYDAEFDEGFLGDIAVGLEILQKEAKSLSISLEKRLAHVLIHGCLHLLGYDHYTEEEKKIMQKEEDNVIKKLGYALY